MLYIPSLLITINTSTIANTVDGVSAVPLPENGIISPKQVGGKYVSRILCHSVQYLVRKVSGIIKFGCGTCPFS